MMDQVVENALLSKEFGASDLARISGFTVREVSNFADRGLIKGTPGPSGKGCARVWGAPSLMHLMGARALMNGGIKSPADAFRLAVPLFDWTAGDIVAAASLTEAMVRLHQPKYQGECVISVNAAGIARRLCAAI